MDQAYIQDLVSVYSDFHIYMFISKSEAGTVFAGYVRAGRRIGLFFRTEHNKAQDEKKDGQTYENGSVDHFFLRSTTIFVLELMIRTSGRICYSI